MLRRSAFSCVLVVFISLAVYGWRVFSSQKSQPNVLVILLDTLRADHLSTYGYERATSPVLDDFAARYVKFNFAITAAPWTPPSVASIFTGKYPVSHGFMPPNSRDDAKQEHSVLGSEHDTLAEIFQRHGYATAAVSPNPWISHEFKFDQGFEDFVYIPRAPARKVNGVAKKIVEKLKAGDKPFFLYLHYLDPHDPYTPPPEFAASFSGPLRDANYDEAMLQQIALYDGEIRYLDQSLGELFEFLKHGNLFDDLMIVIVGDHGEQFMEHGFVRHGNTVFNEEIHVPLFLKFAYNFPHKVIDHTVSTIDIFPTLLRAAGIEIPLGAFLAVPLLDEERQSARRGVMSRISRKLQQRAFVTYDGMKLILGGTREGEMLDDEDPKQNIVGVFDSRKDAREISPLVSYPDLGELQSDLADLLRAADTLKSENETAAQPMSDDTLKQLKSLGYLN